MLKEFRGRSFPLGLSRWGMFKVTHVRSKFKRFDRKLNHFYKNRQNSDRLISAQERISSQILLHIHFTYHNYDGCFMCAHLPQCNIKYKRNHRFILKWNYETHMPDSVRKEHCKRPILLRLLLEAR